MRRPIEWPKKLELRAVPGLVPEENMLLELFNFLENMEREIGDGARVRIGLRPRIFTDEPRVLALRIDWPNDFHYGIVLRKSDLIGVNADPTEFFYNKIVRGVKRQYSDKLAGYGSDK